MLMRSKGPRSPTSTRGGGSAWARGRRVRAANRVRRLFPDAEARKDPAEEIVTGEFAGNFVQSLLRYPELLSDELTGAAFLELTGGLFGVAPRAGQRVQMTL